MKDVVIYACEKSKFCHALKDENVIPNYGMQIYCKYIFKPVSIPVHMFENSHIHSDMSFVRAHTHAHAQTTLYRWYLSVSDVLGRWRWSCVCVYVLLFDHYTTINYT